MAVGPPIKEKKRMHDFLEAITFLKTRDLHGANIIGGYHAMRVAPLMACVLPLYGMPLGVQLVKTTLARGCSMTARSRNASRRPWGRATMCSRS